MFDVYAVWPGLLCVAAIVLLAATPLFGSIAPLSEVRGRVRSIDGLRGYLALAVALQHAEVYYSFVRTGQWFWPPSRFYTVGAQFGVGFFFLITGYLFWGKVIRAQGRLDARALLLNRLFRLGPLYLVVAGVAVLLIWLGSGAILHVPPVEFARQVLQDLALGIFPFGDINGVLNSWTVLAGVTWSLQYEWAFYFCLPLLALAARRRYFLALPLLAFIVLLALSLAAGPLAVFASLFAGGMIVAAAEAKGWRLGWHPHLLSVLALGLLAAEMWMFPLMYQWEGVLVMGAVFYLIVSGASFFGLLLAKPSIRLGEISYGIYLAQGLLLVITFAAAPFRWVADPALGHWLTAALALVLLVFAALALHLLVERPGVALGRRLSASRVPPVASDARHAIVNGRATDVANGAVK